MTPQAQAIASYHATALPRRKGRSTTTPVVPAPPQPGSEHTLAGASPAACHHPAVPGSLTQRRRIPGSWTPGKATIMPDLDATSWNRAGRGSRKYSAVCRHRRFGARPLGALRAAGAFHPLPAASHAARLGAPAVGQAAPSNGAKLRRDAPYPRLATGQARARRTMLRHRRSPSADIRAARMTARRKQGWPDPLRRRQESPAQARHAPAPVQVAKAGGRQRSSWSSAPGPSWRAASAGHARSSARCRSQIPAVGEGHCAAALLYFAAVQGP